ncbi:DUF1206 domain-containing protein [Aquipuribacter sp. MA13-6]|uniref:DUF1206 domain-containing protein n=1 Tax=unclassified Aquipuribacter TaxID=2635084 RepID=UPI003EEC81B7
MAGRREDLGDQAKDSYEDVKDSDEVDTLQRVGRYGYVVYGLVHVVLGALAVSLAFGGGSEEDASTTGAMQTLAEQPFGMVLIWAIAVGMAALVVWQLLEAVLDPDDEGAKGRVKGGGKAVAYGVVAAGAFSIALSGGSGGSGGSTEESMTQRLLALPLGQVLVGAVAVGILVVAAYHVHKGLSRKFFSDVETADLSAKGRKVVEWTGLIGYPAKGVAFGAIGVLFMLAAIRGSSEEAGGMDEGLAALREAPFGTAVLVAVGLGFALFGVYCLARARSAGDFTGFAGR